MCVGVFLASVYGNSHISLLTSYTPNSMVDTNNREAKIPGFITVLQLLLSETEQMSWPTFHN